MHKVYLLYLQNLDNRSGEEFVHAFVGFPTCADFVNAVGFRVNAVQATDFMSGEHVTIDNSTYWIEEQ